MKKLCLLLTVILFLNGLTLISSEKNQHFSWNATISKQKLAKNEQATVAVNFNFEKGWYIYDVVEQIGPEGLGPQKTEFSFLPKGKLKLAGKIKTPKPYVKYDSAFFIDIRTFKGSFTFEIPVVALTDIDIEKDKIFLEVYLQQCKDELCLPGLDFKTQILPIETDTIQIAQTGTDETESGRVAPTDEKTGTEETTTKTEASQEIETYKSRGIWAYLLFAMSAGALALLTPCVFPMVPITVSFFTKRAEKNPGRGLRDSLVYGLGIILTFTALGFILALLFGASGIQNFATNPWLNLLIAAIFIVFSLNLFGAFEFQLPTSFLNLLNTKSQGSGIVSVLLMGLTFSLTSFTCTVPFVGVALVSAAGGEWFYPIVGMLGFSFVFALPFFLLALFPSFISKLPRSGTWMNNIKVVMGLLEIAAAVKFISNADLVWGLGLMPRELFLSIWIGCGLLISLYILGVFRLPHDEPIESVGTMRILFSVFFLSISFFLLSGLFGAKLGELDSFLPPPDYYEIVGTAGVTSASVQAISDNTTTRNNPNVLESKKSDEIFWYSDYSTALKVARETGKMVFIDFSGFTCTNCRWMELNMFTKPQVKQLLSEMVTVRLFTDRKEEPYISNKEMQMQRFNSIDLPLYVIQTPDEKVIATKAFTRDVNEFVSFLQKAFETN